MKHWVLLVLRCFVCFPAALQSTCCLPEPWTKHITAPKQHGILLYLPTATPVLPPDPPLLKTPPRHHTHAQTHPRILTRTHNHRPRQPHLNECTEGCWDICNINNKSLSKKYQRALCCNALFGHSETVFFTLKHRRPSIGNTAFE